MHISFRVNVIKVNVNQIKERSFKNAVDKMTRSVLGGLNHFAIDIKMK